MEKPRNKAHQKLLLLRSTTVELTGKLLRKETGRSVLGAVDGSKE